MQTGLLILQIVFSIGIVIAVLLQPEGTGLGSTWGGGGDSYHTKRGVEKVLFYATILMIVLFTLTSILQLLA
ncbi:MAG: preprotein translocase subunit SecG [Candidatus Pacebacteria bacterium]|nr:preprotein translocase subunit SecG [Candidatus Paceibacterota bacterium]PIR63164.1 MAG: preprotein translocase subunit SecG [Candidatus Pacebacteria bacterium CG10_big_fil_rev_8_21_14_0_10_40_26]PIZ78194.1 MAG: preprotein translocase subunit SecG [Candidatus Pacebacteria bacterium CG_4_10_14_0_2_um_filter_40_20]PJA68761.1 MAG: preprotein translocase subunit SecG [Candidatus Pacebacteria bacterium CG_4_9_14_3_um_filter_40_12]PJC41701.1 MAG: preprotein translocase subunit SecG [Candidatus Pac